MNNLEELREYEMLKRELNKPLITLGEVTTLLCELIECRNCPVCIENYDRRTEFEKTCLHEPCVSNLYKWVKDKCITEYVERLKQEYGVLQGEHPEICKEVFDRFDKLKEEVIDGKSSTIICKTESS